MAHRLAVVMFVSLAGLVAVPGAWAQGHGNGWSRGLGGAAHSGGLGAPKATGNLSRATGTARDFGRNSSAMQRATGAAAENPARILAKRTEQAEHLRMISERNGNPALLETADRMQANATRNYDRQSGRFAPPATEEQDPADSGAEPTTEPAAAAAPEAAPTTTNRTAPRGFWFRSR